MAGWAIIDENETSAREASVWALHITYDVMITLFFLWPIGWMGHDVDNVMDFRARAYSRDLIHGIIISKT